MHLWNSVCMGDAFSVPFILFCLLSMYRHVWVFIAQMVEHCSTNAEAMGLNPVEVPKSFFGVNLQLLKLHIPMRRSYLVINE